MTSSTRKDRRRLFVGFGVAVILCSVGLLVPTLYFISEAGRWKALPSPTFATPETGLMITGAERLFWGVTSYGLLVIGMVLALSGLVGHLRGGRPSESAPAIGWQGLLEHVGLGILALSCGLVVFDLLLFRHSNRVITLDQTTVLVGTGWSLMLLGALFAATVVGVGEFRRVVHEGRCPACRHRIASGEDRCPECGAHLAVDARSHFVVLAKVDRDGIGRCRRCGGPVNSSRVMSQELPTPGQVRCRDCGNLRPSEDSGVVGQ